jgi:hypothetical protein
VAVVHRTWGSGPITGSANLSQGGKPVPDCQDVQLLLGVTYCTINFNQAGTTTVNVVYVNDLAFAGSSDTSLQVVNKSTTSLKISLWPPPAPGAKETYTAAESSHGELHRGRYRHNLLRQSGAGGKFG